ncbi:hypothetical protein IL38_11850 [Actinopolyspora erythraea]|uniref:Uncharacterized protein n=1 Tax=Actinopolyspora erythraea TaxID=414996 RepID=A0ABR4X4K3_9ACTN|nr:hypothetical protein IL38_11850 [Actinopolyspora erythraea]
MRIVDRARWFPLSRGRGPGSLLDAPHILTGNTREIFVNTPPEHVLCGGRVRATHLGVDNEPDLAHLPQIFEQLAELGTLFLRQSVLGWFLVFAVVLVSLPRLGLNFRERITTETDVGAR